LRCKSTEHRDTNLNFVPRSSNDSCFSNNLACKMNGIFACLNLFCKYIYIFFCVLTSFALQIHAIVKRGTRPDTDVRLSACCVPVWCFWSYPLLQASLASHSIQTPLAVQASLALCFFAKLSDFKFCLSLTSSFKPPYIHLHVSHRLTFLYQF